MSIDIVYSDEEIRLGNQRLLELADFTEKFQQSAESKGYDQTHLQHKCGAPACLLGHGVLKWPKEVTHDEGQFFAITEHDSDAGQSEWALLFSTGGCDNAGEDWRKAVDFVRKFVANREAKILEKSHEH